MEMSILNRLKTKALTTFDQLLFQQGSVLDVRAWPGCSVTEIDLHLPATQMAAWNEVPYIKFRVGELQLRDYTPFGWDAETSTCSLLVDAGHKGPGSDWARGLRAGDRVQYLKVDTSRQAPHPTSLVVGLGDCSSLGHLLALQQLTLPGTRFDGAMLAPDGATGSLLREYFGGSISAHANETQFSHWLNNQGYCAAHTSFYLTGNQSFVIGLRKLLRGMGYTNIQTKAFWS